VSTEQKRSRLSESLLHSIQGGQRDDDSFASKQDMDSHDIPIVPESRNESFNRPEKIDRLTGQRKKSVLIIVGIAIAIAIGGFALASVIKLQKQIASSATSVQSELVDQRSFLDQLSSKAENQVQKLGKQAELIDQSLATKTEIEQINNKISGIIQELDSLKTEFKSIHGKLGSQESVLKSKDKNYQQLESKLKGLNTKLSDQQKAIEESKKIPPKPIYLDPTVLENAKVVSIDRWGTSPFVMLRDATGWVSVAVGDSYLGWQLDQVLDGSAVFKKNGESRTVSAEE
jgi:hypothetical protein